MRDIRVWAALAIVVVMAASVRADGGTLLRYKWVEGQQDAVGVTVDTAGKITTTSAAGTQTAPVQVHAALTMFTKVDKVTPDGLAHLKMSFGLISFDTLAPDGTAVHGEMNLADNTIVITAGGQRQVQPLPPGSVDMLAKGFTPIVDDRGQMKGMEGGGSMADAFAKMPGAGGTPNLGQLMSGLDPILPETPVKIGDTWEVKLPLEQLLGQPGAKPIIVRFKYEGDEAIDDVACRHFSALVEVTDMTMSLPAAAGTTIKTDMTKFSVQATSDYYMSILDTHLVLAKVKAVEAGTIHVQGTQKGADGAEVPVDMTMTLEDFKVSTEIKRQ